MAPDNWQKQTLHNDATIPDGWHPKKLSEVSDIRLSNVDKKSISGEIAVRLCNYLDVYNNNSITNDLDFMEATASYAEITRFAVELGDVIITKDSETPDDIGIPAVSLATISDLVCGYHLALIKPNREEVEPVFLAGQIAHERISRYFGLHANGTTRFGLTASTIANTPLWLPPLPEQRRIAEILATADAAIRETERVIAKLRQVKAGLLHDLLTRGLDADGRLRDPQAHPEGFKDSPLGRIPREWEATTLGDVVSKGGGLIQTGPFGSQLHAYEYTKEGVPVIMPQDIQDARISVKQIARIPMKRAEMLARHRVKLNDVVFARRGDLSRCASIDEREVGWLCGTGCLLVRPPKDAANGFWLSAIYQHDVSQRQIAAKAVGSTMVNLNTTLLESLVIALPSVDEQNRVVATLDSHDARIHAEEATLAKLRQLKRGLMDDLLTGRVRMV
jgi:type I restriction enzyme S subunit